jgi:UDPglucose 6-dehydrogenase
MASILAQPLLVDLRNIYPPEEAKRAGLEIVSIGKPKDAGDAVLPEALEAY